VLCPALSTSAFIGGNALSQSIEDIWSDSEVFAPLRNHKANDIPNCAVCENNPNCVGGCKARVYMLHGRFNASDTSMCPRVHELKSREAMTIHDLYPSRNGKIIWKIFDEKTVVLDLRHIRLHVLDGMGSKIWNLLNGEKKTLEIVSTVSKDFKSEGEQNKSSIYEYLQRLTSNELVTLNEAPVKRGDSDERPQLV
jgi:radical SAM protein with 4Fe4S-binding SPASM domain